MKSDHQLARSLVNELSTTHQFYDFLESQVEDLERIVQNAERSHPFAQPCSSARRLMMVHMGIILIIRVLEADQTIFVQNGLKWRVFNWANEETILCKKTVEQARLLIRMLRSIVLISTFQYFREVVDSDSESREEDSSDGNTISGTIDADFIRESSSEDTPSEGRIFLDERGLGLSSESENLDDRESESSDDRESESSDDHESGSSNDLESENSDDHVPQISDHHESESSDDHESGSSDDKDSEETDELIADYPY